MTDGEPETVVLASLQKLKSIKNPIKYLFIYFYLIKSETSDSFVNHFDGHFAYLKTLDFYFKHQVYILTNKYFISLPFDTHSRNCCLMSTEASRPITSIRDGDEWEKGERSDLFWANLRVQHHLPLLDLTRTRKSV